MTALLLRQVNPNKILIYHLYAKSSYFEYIHITSKDRREPIPSDDMHWKLHLYFQLALFGTILPKENQWEMQRSIWRRCWPKQGINGAVEECKHLIILTELKSSWEKSPPLKSWHIHLVTAIRHFLIQTDSQSFINLPLLLHKVNLNLSEAIPKLVLNKCWLV